MAEVRSDKSKESRDAEKAAGSIVGEEIRMTTSCFPVKMAE